MGLKGKVENIIKEQMRSDKTEKLFWSIALPGFGQFLNQQYLKGIILLILEFLINVKSNLNQVIILSFHGDIRMAIDRTNYQWLMFYPCVYMFGIWDAYKDGNGDLTPYSYLPFVFAAFSATIGLIFSDTFQISGVLIGPVWLTMLFCCIGIGLGIQIRKLVGTIHSSKTS